MGNKKGKKREREYEEKYGHIPNDFFERFAYILEELRPTAKDLKKVKEAIKKLQKAKWIPLNFIFYFVPEATPRARYNGFTKIFYVRNAKDNSTIFKEFVDETEELKQIITTPCKFFCDIFLPMSPGMNKVEKILAELKLLRYVPKPDWDNAGKTYSDMVQQHLILNDCLIVDGLVRKFYSFKPRIEIHIEYMEKYDCNFNKKKIESWKSYQDSIDKIEEKDSII
jgi:Holliday junction resolvase RusA-like endonuclease